MGCINLTHFPLFSMLESVGFDIFLKIRVVNSKAVFRHELWEKLENQVGILSEVAFSHMYHTAGECLRHIYSHYRGLAET